MKLFTTSKIPCVVVAVTAGQASALLSKELEQRGLEPVVHMSDLREIDMREVGAHILEGV